MKSLFTFLLVGIISTGGFCQTLLTGEYFIDTDPGFGQGTPFTVLPGTDDQSITFQVNPTLLEPLSNGIHMVYVRTRDTSGSWSHTHSSAIYKAPNSEPSVIIGFEYFFDVDPGFGNGQFVAVTPQEQDISALIGIQAGNLTDGPHTLYVRSLSNTGNWSHTAVYPFEAQLITFVNGSIQSCNETICAGEIHVGCSFQSLPESVDPITYRWYRKAGSIPNPGVLDSSWNLIQETDQSELTVLSALDVTTTFACRIISGSTSVWAQGAKIVTVSANQSNGAFFPVIESYTGTAPSVSFGVLGAPAGSDFQWYYNEQENAPVPANCEITTDWIEIPTAFLATYNTPSGITTSRSYACYVTPPDNPGCLDPCWANGYAWINVEPLNVEELSAQVRVYPNPASDIIQIESNNLLKRLRIFDTTGRLLLEQSANALRTQLDVSFLTPGTYLITTGDQSNTSHPLFIH